MLAALAVRCIPAFAPACTCIPRPVPATRAEARGALRSVEILLAGRVLNTAVRRDSAPDAGGRWFRYVMLVALVEVTRVWKGEVGDTVEVETPQATEACGAELTAGLVYLVDGRREAGYIGTTKCGWTRPLEDARPLLALLRRR